MRRRQREEGETEKGKREREKSFIWRPGNKFSRTLLREPKKEKIQKHKKLIRQIANYQCKDIEKKKMRMYTLKKYTIKK